MEKICRNCKFYRYHRFAGYCSKKCSDTYDWLGYNDACDKFVPKTEEEAKELTDYEDKIMFPFLNKGKEK